MDIKLTTCESMTVTPKWGNHSTEIEILGVSASDFLEAINDNARKELISRFRPDEILECNDVEEILGEIGIDRIKQYLIEYD